MIGFPHKLVSSLRCVCGGAFDVEEARAGTENTIVHGELVCVSCKRTCPIRDGIVHYVPLQQEVLSETASEEMEARDKQAEAYDTRLAPRYEREVPHTLKLLGDTAGHRIIEYGCGTGRFTLAMGVPRLLLATDVSLESLRVLRGKLGEEYRGVVGLVWADVVSLRITPASFDRALSAQVYEHIVAKPDRIRFLHAVRRTLTSEGVFVLSAYHYDRRRKARGGAQTGQHDSGSHFTYFTHEMLHHELAMVFPEVQTGFLDPMFPGSGRLPSAVGHWMGQLPFLRSYAHLVSARVVNDVYPGTPHISKMLFLKKYWFWFVSPFDISDAVLTNFFTYEKGAPLGFHEREGMTTTIDLTVSLEAIWEGMRKKFVRTQITKGERNGIVVQEGNHLFPTFTELYRAFRAGQGLHRDRVSIFKDRSVTFVVYVGDQPIAGGLFVSDGNTMRAYALASLRLTDSGPERERVGQANRMVLWEAVQFAHKSGHTRFDLGGINPDSSNPQLVRLAEFKEAFGGVRCHNYYYYKVYSPLLRFWMRWRGLDV